MNQLDLNIFDRSYKLACEPSQTELLRAAAKHVDSKLREMRGQLPRLESDRLAVMVCLELCQELLNANKALQEQASSQRLLRQMTEELERTVAAGAAS